jgi:hypothetical protein
MADLGEGPIIAVDVKTSFERPSAALAAGDGTADARLARAERPPSLAETLTRVLLLGSQSTSESARRHADLIIKPRAEGIGLLEFPGPTKLPIAHENAAVVARPRVLAVTAPARERPSVGRCRRSRRGCTCTAAGRWRLRSPRSSRRTRGR